MRCLFSAVQRMMVILLLCLPFLKEIRTALSLWLETAREIGKEIPPGILSGNVQSAENDTDYISA